MATELTRKAENLPNCRKSVHSSFSCPSEIEQFRRMEESTKIQLGKLYLPLQLPRGCSVSQAHFTPVTSPLLGPRTLLPVHNHLSKEHAVCLDNYHTTRVD
ncbi:hypothetical protein ABKN59_001802 [Abortiporus biennis]